MAIFIDFYEIGFSEICMASTFKQMQGFMRICQKWPPRTGDKYDFWAMIGAEKDVSRMLNEEDPYFIRERVRRKEYERQRENREPIPQHRKKDRGWER